MEHQDLITEGNTPTILVVVDEATKAARLMPVLVAERYQVETVLSISPPLPTMKHQPDLGIVWFLTLPPKRSLNWNT